MEGATAPAAEAFLDLPSVRTARLDSVGGYRLDVGAPHIALPALLDRLASWRQELTNLTTRHASLEDVFVQSTGRLYFKLKEAKFWTLKENSVPTSARLCRRCGGISFFGDLSVVDELIDAQEKGDARKNERRP